MPEVLNLENLPPDVLADLREAAAKNGTTVEAEAVARVVRVNDRGPLPPLGEPIPSPEMIAPYHFPPPVSMKRIKARHRGPLKPATGYGEAEAGQ